MAHRFAEITFTPSVQAAQSQYNSRETHVKFESSDQSRDILTGREIEFIHERDGFYQATVGETGWPYVQFRGGPPGFLKVLDAKTIGYADFRGNRQYVSVGNMAADDRIALILMDYPNRRRLKILGRAKVVHAGENQGLITHLELSDYRARVERAVVIAVEAYDWNCPQHIRPRFTVEDIEGILAPLQQKIADLEAENAQLKVGTAS